MTLMGKATEKGLEEVAQRVLAPHFGQHEDVHHKFAIRPTLRNHNALTRDGIIRQVAAAVGPGHQVDLKGYDKLILVEAYKNICGISVVPGDFEKLKRYNLAEIYDATSAVKQAAKEPRLDKPSTSSIQPSPEASTGAAIDRHDDHDEQPPSAPHGP